MGTNYTAYVDRCPNCGRSDELHIGKRSIGWRFCWRAHPSRGLKTRTDWEQLLTGKNVTIRDEYGHDVDVKEFLEMVSARDAQPYNEGYGPDDYLDPAGNRFYDGEFS